MVDVSSTIIVGEWTLRPQNGYIVVVSPFANRLLLSVNEARNLAQALQLWIERTAEVVE